VNIYQFYKYFWNVQKPQNKLYFFLSFVSFKHNLKAKCSTHK
jgi:hypothetical protein